jgi:spore coat polysaccharide biosynthesis predicted glycosyltransferase SpsG
MKILCVCHAGTGVGLGHMTRALVAARALQQEFGADLQLLIQGDFVISDDLSAFPHQFIGFDLDLAAGIEEINRREELDVVLFDLHPQRIPLDFDSLLDRLRVTACRLVAVDGLLRYRPKLDLIFHPSFLFVPPADLQDGAPIVHGWDCLLLNVQETPRDWRVGPKVLALTGGSDATRLGTRLPDLLNQSLPRESELHWVTGPFAVTPNWPLSPRIRMIEHVAPTGLGPLMQQANYAVTVYGVSFFELLYLGVPTVVFSPYGTKDDAELSVIAIEGVALVAKDEFEAVEKLMYLMRDDELAGSLSQKSLQQMAVPGGQTFARAVRRILEEA